MGSMLGGTAAGVRTFFARRDRVQWEPAVGDPAEAELARWPYRVLVLNRGAHFVPDGVFVAELDASLRAIRAKLPHLIIVWRATIPGSYQCEKYSVQPPLANLSIAYRERDAWPYDWEKYELQNALARSLFRKNHPHVLILDPVGPCMLRPGTRVAGYTADDPLDCLHWGMPGPPDMWNVALIEMLDLLLQQAKTVSAASLPLAERTQR